MNTLFINPALSDDERRKRLFDGQICVYPPGPASLALVEFARLMIEEAFGELDPVTAQHQLTAPEYECLLNSFKPAFINHARSKQLVQAILLEMGCDPEKTYFDVPRMRTATSNQFLSRGIAYSFEAHRDTWFSGPLCQVNWWFPIYEHESGNTMAFHPEYWAQAIPNGSEGYNCHEWYNEGARLAQNPGVPDRRQRPQPVQALRLDPQVRVISPVGGITVFSAAQMHSTVPNHTGKTRFSIDFRTVNLDDLQAHCGAPNYDSACTGTTLADYYRLADLCRLPPALIAEYEAGTPLESATYLPQTLQSEPF
ncbi:hypothetical protein [Hymenobacter rigui]|uniref:Phytanoyl-CoA dioxygenase family protein n=1 Tax=Hymenobacter rigui TaxID=334424 RepID=A0A428KR65_9BACT|nr:hypothetical protein [Hymenobacter rigui]RSK48982.1 hypothetical protein EI291_10520 [Hymenobacter rigui]